MHADIFIMMRVTILVGLLVSGNSYNYEGDIGIYGMAVLAYFSYGISVFSLKHCGTCITILEILRYI
jgi:hypothetical protein